MCRVNKYTGVIVCLRREYLNNNYKAADWLSFRDHLQYSNRSKYPDSGEPTGPIPSILFRFPKLVSANAGGVSIESVTSATSQCFACLICFSDSRCEAVKAKFFFGSKPVGENMVRVNAQGSSAMGEELELELRADLISSVERLKGWRR